MNSDTLTTQQASEKSNGLLSSKDFARLARRGKIERAIKENNIWKLPNQSVEKYISEIETASFSMRLVYWWNKTSEVPQVILFLLIFTFFVEGLDLFLNITSLSDMISANFPLFVDKADEDEILILVSEFRGRGDYDPATKIYNALDEAIKQEGLDSSESLIVEVQQLSDTPNTQEDAIKLGERYNASIIVWGSFDNASIEPHIEFLKETSWIYGTPEVAMKVNEDQKTYHLYLAQGLPNEIEFLTLLIVARSYMYLSEYSEAIELLSAILELDIGNTDSQLKLDFVYALRGDSYKNIHDFKNAEADYASSANINPYEDFSFNGLATVNIFQGEFLEALEACELGLETNETSWMLYFSKAVALQQLGRHDEAVLALDSALHYFSGDETVKAFVFQSRADSYASLQNWELAQADFESSQKIFPDNPVLYHNWGNMKLNSGNFDTAIEYFNLALEHGITDPKTTQLRGVAYRELGEFDKARADFDTVIATAPSYGGGYYDRAILERLTGNFEEAISDFERTIEIWPDNAGAYEELSIVYIQSGDWQKVITTINKLIEIDGESTERLTTRGLAYLNVFEFPKAESDLMKVRAMDPQNYEATYGLGIVWLIYYDNPEEAIEIFDTSLELNNTLIDAYYNKAWALYLLGRDAEAKQNCDMTINLRGTGVLISDYESCAIYVLEGKTVFSTTLTNGKVFLTDRQQFE